MMEPVSVLLACSGLEHAHRGYESFARECFGVLRDDPRLDMVLVKGSGSAGDREWAVPSLHRDARAARAFGRLWTGPIHVEQLAFAFSLQAEILRRRPDVVYLSEWYTGVALAALRRVNRQNYAIVLSNGSMSDRGFEPFDRVHQHTQPAFDHVLARGADPRRQIMLPVAFALAGPPDRPRGEALRARRSRLGLPPERKVIISVAALNSSHKRLDYVIREAAAMGDAGPFLLLVGQPEGETEQLRRLASELLPDDGYAFRSVPRAQVDDLLSVSDAFVLASLGEGLPRALIEALASGIPCLAHDYDVARWALGPHGRFGDLRQPGSLAALLEEVLASEDSEAAMRERYDSVSNRFSWDRLRERYADLLIGAVGRRDFMAGVRAY